MRIGLTSFAFRWAFKAGMTPEEFLKTASQLGAEVVQLCENSGIDRLNDQELQELSELASRLNLVLECGGSGGRQGCMEEGIRRTKCLNGRIYRCVLDSDALSSRSLVKNLRELLPTLRQTGVTLCAENHFRISPHELSCIVREVNDPAVRVCLDPLNSITQLIGPEETLRELLPFTYTAHIKDAQITRSGTGWKISGVPLGKGHLDLGRFITMVTPHIQSLLLESWMDSVDEESALERELSWAKSGLEVIRKSVPSRSLMQI